MLNRLKNLKVVKTLGRQISPKLRWLNFMNRSVDKSSPDYIRMISVIHNYKKKQLQAMDEMEK